MSINLKDLLAKKQAETNSLAKSLGKTSAPVPIQGSDRVEEIANVDTAPHVVSDIAISDTLDTNGAGGMI